jgi:hypothetical protein
MAWRRALTVAGAGPGRSLHVLPQRVVRIRACSARACVYADAGRFCVQPLYHAETAGASDTADEPHGRLLRPIQRALADFPGFEWRPGRVAQTEQLLLAHSPAHVQAVLAPPWLPAAATPATVAAREAHPALRVVGATLDALDAIQRDGYRIAGTLSGGHHHVAREGGVPDAPFNDLAVAAGGSVVACGWWLCVTDARTALPQLLRCSRMAWSGCWCATWTAPRAAAPPPSFVTSRASSPFPCTRRRHKAAAVVAAARRRVPITSLRQLRQHSRGPTAPMR